MPTIALSLFCHAPTQAIREAAFPADEPLDPQGQALAHAAARHIRRVDRAWTSPALRARQTADAMGLHALPDPLLREVEYGHWAGRTLTEVAASDPAGAAAWISQSAAAPHGGESTDQLLVRVASWLDSLVSREGRVVAVTHASVIRAAIVIALDAKPAAFWRIDVPPLSRLRLRGAAGQWTLLSLGSLTP